MNKSNEILILKGSFEKRPNNAKGGGPHLPKGSSVKAGHIMDLKNELDQILSFWENDTLIEGALVSVHYKSIVAKSNRLTKLLSENGKSPSLSVRGARFETAINQDTKTITKKHVFTHYVSLNAIKDSIQMLTKVARILVQHHGGKITEESLSELMARPDFPYKEEILKTAFSNVLFDCWHVEAFKIDEVEEDFSEQSIISLYRTDVSTKDLLTKIGIGYVFDKVLDESTINLRPEEIKLLQSRAPYLISMNVPDMAKMTREDCIKEDDDKEEINEDQDFPAPGDEPIIGVIDTQFNENVYFHEWVEYRNMLSPDIPITDKDRCHGTEVDSIIIDGPRLNPDLDDGCGRFRVRHFGVATAGKFSSFSVIRNIRKIVSENKDIRVWNISLGSTREVRENSISPEAAELDRLQNEFDVLFIIAGTNRYNKEKPFTQRIGAPADSLNSIVVNAVDNNKNAASYTRIGPVLSFFNKPDIAYYGGDGNKTYQRIAVADGSLMTKYVTGTSFAAPWIARKAAYLINIMGLSREVAKALLLDSAAGWETDRDYIEKGYGVPPISINDILKTPEDEIRFILTGSAEAYETYTYNLPVPTEKGKHPFFAKATLVYFPACSRNQGVDYTNTELDIHFGRIGTDKNGKPKIYSINKNMQCESGIHTLYEEDARSDYRKWDNVKHLSDTITSRSRKKKAYGQGLWGMSVIAKERLSNRHKDPLPFGAVITLKEMDGINRIDDFKKLCMARGWLVNTLNAENRVEVYQSAEEEIEWD